MEDSINKSTMINMMVEYNIRNINKKKEKNQKKENHKKKH
jgi:hypothetical protein